jgi:hypothetical protein
VALLVHRQDRNGSKQEEQRMAHNTSVMGIYPDRTTVSDAISVLHKTGYRPTDISVLASDNVGSKDFGHERRTKALMGAALGAAIGAAVGAALAIVVALGIVPGGGLEALAAAGPVLAAIAGAGAGGAVGWLGGLLAGMRLTEYVARRYAGRIRSGGILLSVHCDSPEWCARAKKTLRDTGARCVSSATEAAADYGTSDKPTERAPAAVPVTVPLETPAPQAVEVLSTDIPK